MKVRGAVVVCSAQGCGLAVRVAAALGAPPPAPYLLVLFAGGEVGRRGSRSRSSAGLFTAMLNRAERRASRGGTAVRPGSLLMAALRSAPPDLYPRGRDTPG